ncbi:MAG: lytic transglycosylase F [Rhodospirillales bacterium]|nr:lytic transglycosylase F [Rhodospirillales bacterium]MDH3970282.1 lytic transglycosylase F [Rhodospirillales bacterium]
MPIRSRAGAGTAALGLLTLAALIAATPPRAAEGPAGDPPVVPLEVWHGDLDGMIERRRIRVLVSLSKTFYFLDKADQRGLTYELMKAFEKDLNKRLKLKTRKIHMVFIPVRRDELLPALVEGRGDIAAANLTITPERRKLVDFSDPYLEDVSEILVTGPAAPKLESLEDLAGQEIYVRQSSSYYESLVRLNKTLRSAGKTEVSLIPADENLEDEDLLEMVNAGLIPMIVMDSHKAEFWEQIFADIELRPDLAVNRGGRIAWAVRKGSPELVKEINVFVKKHKKGTLVGNILFQRYLKDTNWVRNALSGGEIKRFQETLGLFKKHAKEFGFDSLMIAAQAYQESRIDQSKRSPRGAIGIMQILPSTAADPNVDVHGIEETENNILAGVKYLRFIADRYFADEGMDPLNRLLFAFAAYNAGPAKISRLRRRAAREGLDPNVWFRNVELVAAKVIGRETVQYVSNIYKYHIAYKGIVARSAERQAVKQPASVQ